MRPRLTLGWLLTIAITADAMAAGRLVVERAWIRAAPPGTAMLAGYAILKNGGDAPLTVIGADSADFGDVSLHRSVEENGVERMVPLGRFEIAAGASVEFSPGSRHFMLMQPARALVAGDRVKIHIQTDGDDGVAAEFSVRADAPDSH